MSNKWIVRIYPDSEDTAHRGRVAFVSHANDTPITGQYYVMATSERAERLQDLPARLQAQHPSYFFMPLGIMIYDLEDAEALFMHDLTNLVYTFINEAQRDYPAIWRRICQTAKKEAFA